ncbi:MAG: hypothetical protein WKF51_11075 [Geodermatophilaceae bacterium]
MRARLLRALRVVPIVAALTIAGGVTAAPAQASYQPGGMVCTAIKYTNFYRNSDSAWIYGIRAGSSIRVHYANVYYFYGHGAGHTQDGWANRGNFWNCRR